MYLRIALIGLYLICSGAISATWAEQTIKIGNRLEPLIDDHLIADMEGVQLRLNKPIAREVSLVHDQPWEGNVCAYYTVFQEGDLYRMYYRGAHYDEKSRKHTHEQVYCYAQSKDGIHWTKPTLGLIEFAGSKRNNIILKGKGSHNLAPFRDTNPSCKPDEKYKAMGSGPGGLFAFKSPDGIRWTLMDPEPVITEGAFDSQNLAFWDATRNQYVDFHRDFRNGVRDIKTCTSKDFLTWSDPDWIQYPGSPAEHLYTNAITPYHRAPHIFMGFPKRFVPSRNPLGHRNGGVSDGVFMTSRDGVNFRRWHEALIRPGLQQERWVNRNNMTAWGIVQTESNLPGTPKELSIYSNEGYYRGQSSRLRRFTVRLDGFVSIQAPGKGGSFTTHPLIFDAPAEGQDVQLVINYSTSAAGSVRCELLNAAGKPIPGFSMADCQKIFGDQIERAIAWRGTTKLNHLAGKPVRLRFQMHDADLYSLCFH